MIVWTCKRFTGRYPVGTAAVVIAETAYEAAARLNYELRARLLPGDAAPADMLVLCRCGRKVAPAVRILCDGEY